MPSSWATVVAISSWRSASPSPTRRSSSARSAAGVWDHGSNAARAAATARSTSAGVRLRDPRHHLLGGGVHDVERLEPDGLDPLPADVQPVPYLQLLGNAHRVPLVLVPSSSWRRRAASRRTWRGSPPPSGGRGPSRSPSGWFPRKSGMRSCRRSRHRACRAAPRAGWRRSCGVLAHPACPHLMRREQPPAAEAQRYLLDPGDERVEVLAGAPAGCTRGHRVDLARAAGLVNADLRVDRALRVAHVELVVERVPRNRLPGLVDRDLARRRGRAAGR